MKKNCHNCKFGYWDSSDADGFPHGMYFVCEKRDAGDDIKLENNLARPDYLEKSKVCCDLKEPSEMIVDLICPECNVTFAGFARDSGDNCFDCCVVEHLANQ